MQLIGITRFLFLFTASMIEGRAPSIACHAQVSKVALDMRRGQFLLLLGKAVHNQPVPSFHSSGAGAYAVCGREHEAGRESRPGQITFLPINLYLQMNITSTRRLSGWVQVGDGGPWTSSDQLVSMQTELLFSQR